MKTEIYSSKVAKAHEPYCQGMIVEGRRFIFTSGNTARDISGQVIAKGNIRAQTRQIFENMRAVLEEAGSSLKDIYKMNVYLRRDEDYEGMNEVRKEYFRDNTFVSCTVIVDLHPPDALVEIQVQAAIDE